VRPRLRRPGAAFSLLEVMIAFVVMLVALALAAKLLENVLAQLSWSSRKAIEVSPNLALEQIRTDLRNSSGTAVAFGIWKSAPLIISGATGGLELIYLIEDGNLVRRSIDLATGHQEERVVLDRVVDLRYRDNRDAIEIEVEYLRMAPLTRRDTAAGRRETFEPDHRRMSIVISPRRIPVSRF